MQQQEKRGVKYRATQSNNSLTLRRDGGDGEESGEKEGFCDPMECDVLGACVWPIQDQENTMAWQRREMWMKRMMMAKMRHAFVGTYCVCGCPAEQKKMLDSISWCIRFDTKSI